MKIILVVFYLNLKLYFGKNSLGRSVSLYVIVMAYWFEMY